MASALPPHRLQESVTRATGDDPGGYDSPPAPELYWGGPLRGGKERYGRTGFPLDLGRVARYVAVGDSISEGMEDPRPAGRMIGWADRLAVELSVARQGAGGSPLHYANFAIRGRLLGDILGPQLEEALALSPDLISIWGGGNDVMRLHTDVRALLQLLDRAVARARETGAEVLTATFVDCSESPLLKAINPRILEFNEGVRAIAERRGSRVIDQFRIPSLKDWNSWAPDHIHLSPSGHKIVTQAALEALGLPTDRSQWAPRPANAVTRLTFAQNVQWFKRDVLPWVGRHLQNRSTGDGMEPKFAQYTEVRGPQFLS
ncbi:MAG: SGNH/GDSL hydrolase family protein [Buchananella hordeovulneris]|nr:SGNH/GDSL hydrolase family protein [Buchananella hordeovulneris]